MVAVPVVAGDTLSGIASSHGVSLFAVERANPGIANPNLIFVGQTVIIPSGGSWTPPSYTPPAAPVTSYAPVHTASPSYVPQAPAQAPSYVHHSYTPTYVPQAQAPVYHSDSSGSSGGGLSDIPGVPSSFASCVAERESSDGTNQAYNGGVYGIITASGHDVNGQSVGAQKQAFKEIYDTTGPSAWAADGCPGT